ncbi:MAG: AI-2E family transporter [Eubacterium sp.]|nr:AI-2E family transporter [Eubacterium sp.]
MSDMPTGEKKNKINFHPYIEIGIVIFAVIALSMVLFFVLFRLDGLFKGIDNLVKTLQAVVIGCILAYLINPIVNWFEKRIKKAAEKKGKDPAEKFGLIRGLSILATYIVIAIFLGILVRILMPRVVESLNSMSDALPMRVRELLAWLAEYSEHNPTLSRILRLEAVDASMSIQELIQNDMPSWMQSMVEYLTSGVFNLLKLVLNIIIGLIVSIYVLFSKEKFISQGKKLTYAVLAPHNANIFVKTVREAHKIFIGFVVGRIEDSIIIGIITGIVCLIMQMPYVMIIAVIVGTLNVIPFFGPILGAIPSLFIILLSNPVKAVYFLIYIIIIQEIDGNILGPKIVGHSIGIPPFWIVVGVLLGTGLFGVVGMIAGVPLFAILLYIINETTKSILRKRSLPENSEAYLDVDYINPETKELIYKTGKIPEEKEDTKG